MHIGVAVSGSWEDDFGTVVIGVLDGDKDFRRRGSLFASVRAGTTAARIIGSHNCESTTKQKLLLKQY